MRPSKWMAAGILALAGVLLAAPDRLDDELKALADTERAFARACGEKGIRASFYEFFAEDGIAFQPHPVKLREAQRQRPAPAGPPPPILLEWEPIYGDIAESADLGWLTGPTLFTDKSSQKRPPSYGYYSSIWKKQADGNWRVLVDLGVDIPPQQGPIARNQFRAAPREKAGKPKSGAPADIRQVEQNLARDSANGVTAAYAKYLAPHARMHRGGQVPLTTGSAVRAYLATQPQSGRWETLHAETAKSDDLGYTYGKYELRKDGVASEKGYYVRVWKRNPQGEWKLVFDVTHPLPPEKP